MAATIRVTLPDGKVIEPAQGINLGELARSIAISLGKKAIGAVVDGEVKDLHVGLERDAKVKFITEADPEALDVVRHSCAHLLAQAVKRLWPEAKFGVGPVIENGFYYDMELPRQLEPEDLAKIEAEMRAAAAADFPVKRSALPRAEALAWADERHDPYKRELIEGFDPAVPITFYSQGEFTDLCTGPHVPATGRLKHFKLMSIAGAYWRGDEKRPMLQRIYGTAFLDAKSLEAHLQAIEEAARRDHRKVGKELGLFMFHPLAPASPFFLPKGAAVYNALIAYLRGLYRDFGYQEVVTPQIFSTELFKISGHYDNYLENMYFTEIEEREYGVKPMNCPAHALMFGSRGRSYRELPLRFADFGRLHRYERSGVVAGLTRVRTFAQDDGHIFMAEESIGDEIENCFALQQRIYRDLGLPAPNVLVGTRPEKSVGSDELWQRAESTLFAQLERLGQKYTVNPGDGAFYGPKIDFQVRDAIGRSWQLSTFQLDFNMGERFDLHYNAKDGSVKRPVVVHRAMLGSLERFIGVYLEHTAGNLPLWLAPVQAKVLTVMAEVNGYAREVEAKLAAAGLRVEVDDRTEKIGAKIRDGALEKVPYLLVIGARERDTGSVAVRARGNVDLGALPLDAFVARAQAEVASMRETAPAGGAAS
ncbi:MAG: threonine--tRNA ligase [Planctomycetes bacterium]|nr:threonine--tRNA ligase [Planctomycetota bacterium]